MTLDDFVARLDGVRRQSHGYTARCPVHEDRQPSLSIREGDDGRILLNCFAGCSVEAICAALGIEVRDLFAGRQDRQPERRWDIRDLRGALIATHHRVDTADGKLIWWTRDGRKGLAGRPTAALPLYGIDRLGDAPEVVVAEGEPATDALQAAGIPAVGTVTGASATPGDDALRPLLGRRIILWPDYDDAGRHHMERIRERLRALGSRDLRVVSWGRDPGDDAADAAARGEDLRTIIDAARDATLCGADPGHGTPGGAAAPDAASPDKPCAS